MLIELLLKIYESTGYCVNTTNCAHKDLRSNRSRFIDPVERIWSVAAGHLGGAIKNYKIENGRLIKSLNRGPF